MNISKQHTDDLHAVITVSLEPTDFMEPFEKAVKQYAKKVNMPGFRAGMVPVGMVKKMYGQSLLAEEINRILSHSLDEYIRENDFDLLGNALTSLQDENKSLPEWQSPSATSFSFDIAFAPSFELELQGESFTRRNIQVTDEQVDAQVVRLAQRYGSITYPESIEGKDLVYADLTELDEQGNVKEGGLFVNSPIWLESVKDEATANSLLGLKKDDTVEADIRLLAENETDRASMLKIPAAELPEHQNKFRLKITAISRLAPAEMNAELFQKVFGEEVSTEEEFRSRIRKQIEETYQKDSDTLLFNDIQKRLIEKAQMPMPEAFLKRWIRAVSEKPLTEEQLEADFEGYLRYLRWKLIEKKLMQQFDVQVGIEEIKEYLRGFYVNQYAQVYGGQPEEEFIQQYIAKSLRERKDMESVSEKITSDKLLEAFEKQFSITNVFLEEDKFYEPQTP